MKHFIAIVFLITFSSHLFSQMRSILKTDSILISKSESCVNRVKFDKVIDSLLYTNLVKSERIRMLDHYNEFTIPLYRDNLSLLKELILELEEKLLKGPPSNSDGIVEMHNLFVDEKLREYQGSALIHSALIRSHADQTYELERYKEVALHFKN